MLTRELHNKALVAAETATADYINKYGEHDACGFAWVTAYVNGASKLGKSFKACLLYTSPSPRDLKLSRMPSSA